MLPYNYLEAFSKGLGSGVACVSILNNANNFSVSLSYCFSDVPVILGTTAQEIDFAPGDDVRSFSKQQLATFVATKLQDLSTDFTDSVLRVYNLSTSSPPSAPFQPQKVYAQIVSDLTMYCPNLLLAATLAKGRESSSLSPSSPVYLYSTPQSPAASDGFCPLQPFQSVKGYCPHWYQFFSSPCGPHAFYWFTLFIFLRPDLRRSPSSLFSSFSFSL